MKHEKYKRQDTGCGIHDAAKASCAIKSILHPLHLVTCILFIFYASIESYTTTLFHKCEQSSTNFLCLG